MRSRRGRASASGALQGQQAGTVRKQVVAWVLARVAALVQQLQVAWVDCHRLVRVRTDDVTVTDVVRPGRTRVCLTGERLALRRRVRRPAATQACRRERAEIAAVRALSLHNHEVLASARNSVDLYGLEEVGRRVRHDHRARRAEATREVADWHAGAVDTAVVASEEQVHVLAVTNDRLVDGVSTATDRAAEQL